MGTYTISFDTNVENITGLRLETLSDARLPADGPGTSGNGNFVLSEIEIHAEEIPES